MAKKSSSGELVERRLDCRPLPGFGALSSWLSETVVDAEPADRALSSCACTNLFSRFCRWPIRAREGEIIDRCRRGFDDWIRLVPCLCGETPHRSRAHRKYDRLAGHRLIFGAHGCDDNCGSTGIVD